MSSASAFILNYIVLICLEHFWADKFTLGPELAMVCAWLMSSMVNFSVNRYWVFKAFGNIFVELSQYYALAFPIFIIKNFGLLEILYRLVGMPMWIAAPIAEAALFIVNYIIQKKLIFKKKSNK
jgi:putative flippase GtrA